MERDVLCSMIPSATLRSRHPILAHNVLKEDDWRKYKYLFLLLTVLAPGDLSQLTLKDPKHCLSNSKIKQTKPNSFRIYK